MSEKRLTQDEIWKLLEGHEDILTPLAKKEQTFLRNCMCPGCGSYATSSFVNPKIPFSPGVILPNFLLRCLQCQTEFDPNTNLITSFPALTTE